jgi:digeranylgeranylglycerophospholipid reductase
MTARPHACDALVIGLGPGGAAAAAAAARAGLAVVAIDRRAEIGIPVQCAEFIPLPLGRHARDAGVLVQRILGMTSALPSGARHRTDFPGLMIDRARFDRALAEAAQAAGAMLCRGTSLTGLDAGADVATLRDTGGEFALRYRVLIAADGPRSRVATALNLPRLETVDTRQYTVPLRGPSSETEIWLAPEYPGGYAWLFPKGATANLGLGMDSRLTRDLKQPLDRLHAMLVAEGRLDPEILARTGGPIPVGGMRSSLAERNVAFVGDAAGLTHPITGAGIAAAIISGEYAGESAARYCAGDAEAWRAYEEEIRDQFETSLARAVARRRWLVSRWKSADARSDGFHRRAWIAFPEYFRDAEASALAA